MKLVIADATSGALGKEDQSLLVARFRNLAMQVHLSGIPPFSDVSLRVQFLTGLSPEWTSVFDAYTIKDCRILATQPSPETQERYLWRMVEATGKKTVWLEDELPTYPCDLVYLLLGTSNDVEHLDRIPDEETVKMLVLPEALERPCTGLNINDFFEDKGLVERKDDGSIHWGETLAYHMGHGQIWINLLGREPNGVVSPGKEYLEVREGLIRILTEKLLDNGEDASIIRAVWRKEDIYNENGSFFVNAPDVLVTLMPGYCFTPQSTQLGFETADQERRERGSYACPAERYMFFVWGDNIRLDFSGEGRLIDLVPTALYILDLPIPATLSGKVIEDIFKPEFWKAGQPRYQVESGLTPEEEALLVDRLGDLGYLE